MPYLSVNSVLAISHLGGKAGDKPVNPMGDRRVNPLVSVNPFLVNRKMKVKRYQLNQEIGLTRFWLTVLCIQWFG
jgi:hypothetical protein